jgi:hypothetical protein
VLVHPLGAGRSPTDELERKTAHDTVYFTPPGKNEYYFHSCLKFLVYIQVLFS